MIQLASKRVEALDWIMIRGVYWLLFVGQNGELGVICVRVAPEVAEAVGVREALSRIKQLTMAAGIVKDRQLSFSASFEELCENLVKDCKDLVVDLRNVYMVFNKRLQM
uniref:Uncharacterized protein n=1 Tax=Cannabis sativa TaxID=3483 RepID=A0A803PEL7_CANSA